MHVETSRSHQVLKDGTERIYERHLLRRSYREAGKVRKETLANLSHLPRTRSRRCARCWPARPSSTRTPR